VIRYQVKPERSKEALDFIKAVDKVCVEHGFAIEHEDSHGAFIVRRYNDESDRYWFQQAYEEVR
jgi:hypothetical protein